MIPPATPRHRVTTQGSRPFRGLTVLDGGDTLGSMRFLDRSEAGLHLARALAPHRTDDAVVVAIPRGGVAVGAEVARLLRLPLEVLVACKVPAPGRPEIGLGAVAEAGVRHVDLGLAGVLGLTPAALQAEVEAAELEVARRAALYRRGRARLDLRGRTALVVDDGIGRGGAVRAAVEALRRLGVLRIVVGVPVAAASVADALAASVDAVVALVRPAVLHAIADWYDDFYPLRDADVVARLDAPLREAAGEHVAA
jgi:putative phosphoribosyl transferase